MSVVLSGHNVSLSWGSFTDRLEPWAELEEWCVLMEKRFLWEHFGQGFLFNFFFFFKPGGGESIDREG